MSGQIENARADAMIMLEQLYECIGIELCDQMFGKGRGKNEACTCRCCAVRRKSSKTTRCLWYRETIKCVQNKIPVDKGEGTKACDWLPVGIYAGLHCSLEIWDTIVDYVGGNVD